MFWHRLRGRVKQRSAAFTASKIISIATDDKWSRFLALLSRDSPLPFSPLTLFSVPCASLTVPPWNPWINNSSYRFFTLWLNMKFIPYPILPPTHLSEGAHKTPYVSLPETQRRLCKSPQHYFLPLTAQDHLLSPKMLSQHHLSFFVSS